QTRGSPKRPRREGGRAPNRRVSVASADSSRVKPELWHLGLMRTVRVTLLLAAALVSNACFQMTTVLKVNGDGSGTIVHRMVYTTAALAQLRQFAAIAGGRGGGASADPLSEE